MGRAQNRLAATASLTGFDVLGTRRGGGNAARDRAERNALVSELETVRDIDWVSFLERAHAAGLNALDERYQELGNLIAEDLAGDDDELAHAAACLAELATAGHLVKIGEPLLEGVGFCVRYNDYLSALLASDVLKLICADTAERADSERLTVLAHNFADRLPRDYEYAMSDLDRSPEEAVQQLNELDATVNEVLWWAANGSGSSLRQLTPLLEAVGHLVRQRRLPHILRESVDRSAQDPQVATAAPGLLAALAETEGRDPRPDVEDLYADADPAN